ncbi:hypothetical protein [Embleya sp. NPDC059259]|uniref:hypothetical protein n=1 Tax=unclassified Embleya TaxID=2699296 RepID=UPI0036958D2C
MDRDAVLTNRVAYSDRVVWQGARNGRVAAGMVAGVALLLFAASLLCLGMSTTRGLSSIPVMIPPLAFACGGLSFLLGSGRLARVQANRRFEIGPGALVLHDADGTVPLPWGAVAGVTLTLRPGPGTDTGRVRLEVRLRDGTLHDRSMYYVEEGMFRALALDLFPGPAGCGVPYIVHGSQVITDEIAALAANARPSMPPRPPAPPPGPPTSSHGPRAVPPRPPAPPP